MAFSTFIRLIRQIWEHSWMNLSTSVGRRKFITSVSSTAREPVRSENLYTIFLSETVMFKVTGRTAEAAGALQSPLWTQAPPCRDTAESSRNLNKNNM